MIRRDGLWNNRLHLLLGGVYGVVDLFAQQ